MLTQYSNICAVCGSQAEATHHLIFGTSQRKLSDEDGLIIPLCNSCHTLGKQRLHDNSVAEALSKMLGQMAWEKNYIANNKKIQEDARQAFRLRYGRSYM